MPDIARRPPLFGFIPHTKHISRAGKLIAGLLLVFALLDYASSGPITVPGVTVTEIGVKPASIKRTVTLPFVVGDSRPSASHHFTIPLKTGAYDRLFPLRLTTDGCIREIAMGGKPATIYPADAGQCTNNLPVAPMDGTIDLLLDKHPNGYGVTIQRERLLTTNQALLLVLAAAYLVLLCLHSHWTDIKRTHRVLLPAALFFGTSMYATTNYGLPVRAPIPTWSEWLAFMAYGPAIAVTVLAGWYYAPTWRLHSLANHMLLRVSRLSPNHWALGCSIAFFVLAALLSWLMFDRMPHIADTHTQTVMAKIFLEGKFYEASHALPRFFDFQFMINDGKLYGQYFPGHSFLLAIGMLANAAWLVDPLFGAMTVYLTYMLAREIADKESAMIAALLMLLSPHVVFMSSEFMSHPTCMFFITAFFYCYVRFMKTEHWRYALLAGACIGYALMIRVQTAFPFAIPVAIHALMHFDTVTPRARKAMFIMGGACVFFVALQLGYNAIVTGSPFVNPYEGTNAYEARFIFKLIEPERWLKLHQDLLRALDQVTNLHVDLMGWPASPFIFIVLLYIFKCQPRYSGLMLWCIFGMFLGLMFINPNPNSVFPSRYIYECTSLLIVLVAAGIRQVPQMVGKACGKMFAPATSTLAITLAILTACAWPYRARDLYASYANNYWEGHVTYHRMLVDSVEKPALIFMKHYTEYRMNYFTAPPREGDAVIFALNRDEENSQLMDYYPKRHVYMVDGWNIQKIR